MDTRRLFFVIIRGGGLGNLFCWVLNVMPEVSRSLLRFSNLPVTFTLNYAPQCHPTIVQSFNSRDRPWTDVVKF